MLSKKEVRRFKKGDLVYHPKYGVFAHQGYECRFHEELCSNCHKFEEKLVPSEAISSH